MFNFVILFENFKITCKKSSHNINVAVCTPPEIENGYHTGPTVPATGSTYKYQCSQGYYIEENSSDSLKCLEDGSYEWNKGHPPVCSPISEC